MRAGVDRRDRRATLRQPAVLQRLGHFSRERLAALSRLRRAPGILHARVHAAVGRGALSPGRRADGGDAGARAGATKAAEERDVLPLQRRLLRHRLVVGHARELPSPRRSQIPSRRPAAAAGLARHHHRRGRVRSAQHNRLHLYPLPAGLSHQNRHLQREHARPRNLSHAQ
jgi:hypothetical protein